MWQNPFQREHSVSLSIILKAILSFIYFKKRFSHGGDVN